MRLQPLGPSLEGREYKFVCVMCKQWTPDKDCLADLDGTPFVDYYCKPCAKQKTEGRMSFNAEEALELALTLAISAPDDDKAAQCVVMAEKIAATLPTRTICRIQRKVEAAL